MAKEKSLVEEAILSMKNLEEAVANNAKEILASTMKEEIKELVKESLSEQEEEEIDTDVDMSDDEDEMSMDMDMEDSEEDMDTDNEVEDMSPIDLRGKSNDEIIRVFQLMGPDDNIIVTKDDAGNINLKTDEDEYMIVGESEEEEGWNMEEDMMETWDMEEQEEMDMDSEEEMDMDDSEESIEDIINSVFNDESDLPESPTGGEYGGELSL